MCCSVSKFNLKSKKLSNDKNPSLFYINRFNANLQLKKMSCLQVFCCEFHCAAVSAKFAQNCRIMKWVSLAWFFGWVYSFVEFALSVCNGDIIMKYIYLFYILAFPVFAVVQNFCTRFVSFFWTFTDSQAYMCDNISFNLYLILAKDNGVINMYFIFLKR